MFIQRITTIFNHLFNFLNYPYTKEYIEEFGIDNYPPYHARYH